MDYIPEVNRDDVLRVLERGFRPEDREQVLELLDGWGDGQGGSDLARVQLAILKLSDRSVERVRDLVRERDFRDLIARAEYPGFCEGGFVGVDHMTPKQVSELKARDWQQYQEWLDRE